MSRREFLQLVGAGAAAGLLGCAPARTPARRRGDRRIRAVAFDLFTIFDPRSVAVASEAVAPGGGAELAAAWRARLFEYAFLRAAADQYVDFRQVSEDALAHTARARGLALSPTQRTRLVDAFETLDPWPDAADALRVMRARGLRLAPLTNVAPAPLRAVVARAGLADLFERLISTDAARTFKPHPRAYQLGVDELGLDRDEIVFAAFGGWDAVGATWFGYPTFWVNRLGAPADELGAAPAGAGATLTELAAWIAAPR